MTDEYNIVSFKNTILLYVVIMLRNLRAKTLDVKAYYIIKRGRNVALLSNVYA